MVVSTAAASTATTAASTNAVAANTAISTNLTQLQAALVAAGINTDTDISYYYNGAVAAANAAAAAYKATTEAATLAEKNATAAAAGSATSGDLYNAKVAAADAYTAAQALPSTAVASSRKVITGSSTDVLTVIGKLDSAINKISNERSVLGAAQSRFESAISYLQISTENQTAARSRIMDADFAQETANLSRAQILSQAGSAMLAQANQLPQSVMALLRG